MTVNVALLLFTCRSITNTHRMHSTSHKNPENIKCLEVHEELWLIHYEGKPDVQILNLPKLQGPLTGSFDRRMKSL